MAKEVAFTIANTVRSCNQTRDLQRCQQQHTHKLDVTFSPLYSTVTRLAYLDNFPCRVLSQCMRRVSTKILRDLFFLRQSGVGTLLKFEDTPLVIVSENPN